MAKCCDREMDVQLPEDVMQYGCHHCGRRITPLESALYAVDVIDDKHNDRVAVSETTLTFDESVTLADELYRSGKHVQILGWTAEDGYTIVANYG